jgi:hypothetical protein
MGNFSERATVAAFTHARNVKTTHVPTIIPGTIQDFCVAHKISNMRW